jgi:hypothetical protein
LTSDSPYHLGERVLHGVGVFHGALAVVPKIELARKL